MANYSSFIKTNKAPKDAKKIGVYKDGTKVGEIALDYLQNPESGTPIYSFGLLSDVHLDSTDYNYTNYLNTYPYSDEGEGDLRRALTWFNQYEDIKMVCCCGDMSQSGTTGEFAMPEQVIHDLMPNKPFYTCTSNHDVKTAGGNGFETHFLRSVETTFSGMTNFERSTAFNNSFCFDVVSRGATVGQFVDHYIFLSMYSYSLGDGASPYNADDLIWLENKLSSFKNERTFIFTHLFFRELAGNLGRINGSGGIYPTGNWLGGSQYAKLLGLLEKYPNAIWFSGHSHWKWDLQKYQSNLNVARSRWVNHNNDGAWTVHVPSNALPIDSDYSSTSSETEKSREEKPLESQGGVVDVYENCIVIRGIDFNINTSQNGDTTQRYSGNTYVRYLPIACYNLDTTVRYVDDSEISEGEGYGPVVMITADNMRINTGSSHPTGQTIVFENDPSNNSIVTVDFSRSSQSCVLTDPSLANDASAFRVFYESASVQIVYTDGRETVNVPLNEIDNYFGWLVSYDSSSQGSVYDFNKTFDYTYNLTEEYPGYPYGNPSANGTFLGIQLNTSSKLSNSANACWIDEYVDADDRTSFGTDNPTFHIVVSFTNLRIQSIGASNSGGGETPSTTVSYYNWSDINSMEVNDTLDVIMANPHRSDGYIIGHNGTNAVSSGNGFATLNDMTNAIASVSGNDNYHMIITKKQDTREEFTTTNVARTFTVSGMYNNTTINKTTSVNISGYDCYAVTSSSLSNSNRTGTITITFDGQTLPRTVYAKLYVSNNAATATLTVSSGGSGTVTKGTNQTVTSTSNFSEISMTSNTLTLSNTAKRSTNGQTTSLWILVPNNITEEVSTTQTVNDGDPYYTLTSKVGSYSPTGTTAAASWSTTPMHYVLSNATSLGTSSDLTNGVAASNNTNLIRFANTSSNYLNAGGGLSSLKFATGLGEWSVWYLGHVEQVEQDLSMYIQKSNFETNTNKGSLSVNDRVQDLGNGYVAVSFNAVSTGFWVTIPNGGTTLQVDDLKVYSGMNTTTGTTIALPDNVGFFEDKNHSGTARYQIATGFQPSTTETGSNGRVQFQTSSSYTGGSITIVMKVRFV